MADSSYLPSTPLLALRNESRFPPLCIFISASNENEMVPCAKSAGEALITDSMVCACDVVSHALGIGPCRSLGIGRLKIDGLF